MTESDPLLGGRHEWLCDAGCEGEHVLERAVKPDSCASILPTVNLHQLIKEAVMMNASLAVG